MTTDSDKLIRELLSLYVKYGPATFAQATKMLSRGAVSRMIADVTRELSHAAHATKGGQTSEPKRGRSAKKPSPKDATQRYITGLLSSENEHAASVAKFVEEVAQRAVLRTPSSLRDYVELLGLRPLAKPDRYAHARRIGAYLLALSPKDAEEKITTGRNMTEVTSSLAGWTNIIVKPEPEK